VKLARLSYGMAEPGGTSNQKESDYLLFGDDPLGFAGFRLQS